MTEHGETRCKTPVLQLALEGGQPMSFASEGYLWAGLSEWITKHRSENPIHFELADRLNRELRFKITTDFSLPWLVQQQPALAISWSSPPPCNQLLLLLASMVTSARASLRGRIPTIHQ
jgi:hypothetical protein